MLLVSKLRSYVLCRLRWRRMKSKAFLLHDGSYGCSYLIVWLVGEFDCSLVHAVLIPTFSGSLFWSFWNSAQLEGLQAQCTGTFWTFTLCKLYALAAAKFYVQKISLQYLHILWTPSTIQCLNDPWVSTLFSPWWGVFFLHEDVVVLTRLTTRSPIVGCSHFCVRWIFSWIEAVWLPQLS